MHRQNSSIPPISETRTFVLEIHIKNELSRFLRDIIDILKDYLIVDSYT